MEELIEVARGFRPADTLLKSGKLVNVFSGEIESSDIAVYKGRIVGFGRYEAREKIDLKGCYILPGLMDAHIHVESSMLSVTEFVRAVLPHGTTSVVIDPHEIANVLGLDGIKYILESSKYQPLNIFMMLPSCVPATGLETSGSVLTAYDLEPFLNHEWVLGLGEMMNYPGVLNRTPAVMDKLRLLGKKCVDGHAPALSGKDLYAYVLAGIHSDHECTTLEEAREKLRCGMHIFIREGSLTKNLADIIPLVNCKNQFQFSFCSDDRYPRDLIEEGHINHMIRLAVKKSVDPVTAIRMATYNTARYYKIPGIGAIAPGYWADLAVVDDFKRFSIKKVFKKGRLIAEKGRSVLPPARMSSLPTRSSINLPVLGKKDFAIIDKKKKIRIIRVLPGQLITGQILDRPKTRSGFLESDIDKDLLKITVIERHRCSGNIGKGFVSGFGLKKGALASSFAHDSHNIICVGCDDQSMLSAVVQIANMGGGLVVAEGKTILASLPLPIAGLLTDQPLRRVNMSLEKVIRMSRHLGCSIRDPFMALSFLSLSVIGELKITDMGLVDVESGRLVDLFVG